VPVWLPTGAGEGIVPPEVVPETDPLMPGLAGSGTGIGPVLVAGVMLCIPVSEVVAIGEGMPRPVDPVSPARLAGMALVVSIGRTPLASGVAKLDEADRSGRLGGIIVLLDAMDDEELEAGKAPLLPAAGNAPGVDELLVPLVVVPQPVPLEGYEPAPAVVVVPAVLPPQPPVLGPVLLVLPPQAPAPVVAMGFCDPVVPAMAPVVVVPVVVVRLLFHAVLGAEVPSRIVCPPSR
jgi:hypothetical protein